VDAQTIVYGTLEDEALNCSPGAFTTFLTQTGYHPWDSWWESRTDTIIDYMMTNYDSTISSGKLLDL